MKNKHTPRNRAANKRGHAHKHNPAGSKLARRIAKSRLGR